MPKLTASDLDRIYMDAETVDTEVFSEMRSNLLLISGNHYTKKGSKFFDRIRTSTQVNKETKLKLTKNYIGAAHDRIVGNILSIAPNTTIIPNNEKEIQDIKTAELNKSVWEYTKKQNKMRAKIRDWAEDFVGVGECFCKIYFDPSKGRVVGWQAKIDENGEPIIAGYDQQGNPQFEPDKEAPVMEGKLEYERFLGFNVLRDPETETMDESPYLILRKMINHHTLKNLLKDDELFQKIKDSSEQAFLVFDGTNKAYMKEDKNIMLREHYYRPSAEYPNGYYYICVRDHILFEGELPFGVWNIAHAGYKKIPTSARCISPVKSMRPTQIEINRTSSEIATNQITLGSDKLVLSHGAKMTSGGQLPGVRAISITGGQPPSILQGRGGEQYIPWLDRNINEMWEMQNLSNPNLTREGKLDPYAMLFHSLKNKQQFSRPGETFEEFLMDITEITLALAKEYYDENHLIPMVGKNEMVNISEFKHTEPNSYRIQVEAVSADTETMLGKQLAINHTLQYAGNQLDKEEIGRFIKAMPFMNKEEMFGDLTLKHDLAQNIILALDRGEQVVPNKYDDPEFVVKRLIARMRNPDFKFLDQQIQQNYQVLVGQYEDILVKQQVALMRAQQGYIPTGGYLVKADFYVQTPSGGSKRVELPFESVSWLIKQIEAQGESLEAIAAMNKGQVQDMANKLLNANQGPQQPPQGPQNWQAQQGPAM